jgi:hypothetical protein
MTTVSGLNRASKVRLTALFWLVICGGVAVAVMLIRDNNLKWYQMIFLLGFPIASRIVYIGLRNAIQRHNK